MLGIIIGYSDILKPQLQGQPELFKFVGLKADLGALIVGILISNHKKAKELADSLMSFKDIFLIGFLFQQVGIAMH